MKYGYIRVSTRHQDETRQSLALIEAGVSKDNIFIDKSTGTTFIGREAWEKLLAKVVIGDIIVIKELDRLGRNNEEIKKNFELLNKKGVYLEFLEQPLLNTYGMSKLERELLQPIVLHLLGYFAEKENEKRKTRQAEAYASLPRDEKGRMISRKKNKPVGRPNALDNLTAEQRRAIELFTNSQISLEECIKLSNLKRNCSLPNKTWEETKKEYIRYYTDNTFETYWLWTSIAELSNNLAEAFKLTMNNHNWNYKNF